MKTMYPAELETWWLNRAAAALDRPIPLVPRALEPAANRLSNGFTTGRQAPCKYADDIKAWLAYGLFFFPQTYLRVRFILDELKARGLALPATPRVLDLGAGSGAASAALREHHGAPCELTLLDREPLGMDLAGSLLRDRHDQRVRTIRGDLREPPDGPWDVVLVSYAFNEALAAEPEAEQGAWLGRLARQLAPAGMLILCEPLVESAGPFMDRLRTAALAAGLHIWAPCPHEAACPLAARRSACHDVRGWRLPPAAQTLNDRLGRSIQDLKFSFLALSPAAPAATRDFRLVAPVHPTNGKWELLGCGPEAELRRYEVLKRDVTPEDRRRLGELERGERVELQDLARAGDAWRGRLSPAAPSP